MAKLYTKGVWVDEVLVGTEQYQVKDDNGDVVYANAEISLANNIVIAGTPVNAANMNHIEEGIDALDTLLDTVNIKVSRSAIDTSNSNAETLSANKTFQDSDKPLQFLDPGGADRTVTLPAEASSNHQFVIFNIADAFEKLIVKDDADNVIGVVHKGNANTFISNGTAWFSAKGAYKNLYIGGWKPTVTSGCASSARIEMGTNKNTYDYLAFDKDTIEYAYANVPMPDDYTGGAIYAKFYWLHPATTTNFGVSWGLQAVSFSDDDTLDAAQGTAKYANDTGGTTSDLYISPMTDAITIAGTPVAGDLVQFRVSRKADDATNDTLAVDAYLLGAMIWYPVG